MNVIKRGATLAVAAVLAAGLFHGGVAQAQIYPTPQGQCVITPSVTNPGTNDTVSLTVTVTNLAGSPVAGVEGEAFVVAQPGTDAGVAPTSFTTDASGMASISLSTGSSAGAIQVGVSIDDDDLEAECAIDLLIVAPAAPAPEPAAPVAAPGPPPTGMGAGATSGAVAQPWLIAAALAAVAGFGSIALVRRRRLFRS